MLRVMIITEGLEKFRFAAHLVCYINHSLMIV